MDKDHSFFSERLTYRGISEADALLIVKWRSDPENCRNFLDSSPLDLCRHRQWYERYLLDDRRYDFMILDEKGEPIGTAGLRRIDDATCELSYMIGEVSKRGRGYAKEALRALENLARTAFGAREVVARILPTNDASIHVAEACGFKETERLYRKDVSA